MEHSHGDRRRHRRFDAVGTGSSALLFPASVRDAQGEGESEWCELINFSSGGMCFQSSRPLDPMTTWRFQLHFTGQLDDIARVTAEIRWVTEVSMSAWRIGAAFITSDKAYLGPDFDEYPS